MNDSCSNARQVSCLKQTGPTAKADRLISLSAAVQLAWLPRKKNGKAIHVITLVRWALRGLRGVRLQTVKVGRTRCVTEQALLDFFESLSQVDTHSIVPIPRPPSSRQRDQAARRARRILKLDIASSEGGDAHEA